MAPLKQATAKIKTISLVIVAWLNLFHFVSNSPHHLQIFWFFGIDFDFLPDFADVNRHRVLHAKGIFVPYFFINLVDGKDPSRMGGQQLQYFILDGRQFDFLSVYRHTFALVINFQPSGPKDIDLCFQAAQRWYIFSAEILPGRSVPED
jgi:hypothetical protein